MVYLANPKIDPTNITRNIAAGIFCSNIYNVNDIISINVLNIYIDIKYINLYFLAIYFSNTK